MSTKTPTRADYMAKRVSFADYYRAVARTGGFAFRGSTGITLNEVRAVLARGDEHLNTIKLQRWDAVAAAAAPSLNSALRAHGDVPSLAGLVCIVKQAAIDAANAE